MTRLFKNTVFSGLDAFVLIVLSLTATPILIKHLSVEEYGVFVFLSTFSTYGMLSFFDFGMEGSLLNFVARFDAVKDRRQLQDSLTISLLYYGAIGLVLGLALYLASDIITSRFAEKAAVLDWDSVIKATHIMSLNVVVQFLTLPLTAVLNGLRQYVITKATNSILMTLQYILLLVAAVQFGRVDAALAVVLVITFCRLLVLVYIVMYRTEYFRPMELHLRFDLFKQLISYSSILLVSRLIGLVFNQMAKFLIWMFLAASHMTIYDVVMRPANLVRLLVSTINSAIIPEVAGLHRTGDLPRIAALYVNLVRYSYLLMLPILAVLYVHMGPILSAWVGSELGANYRLSWIMLSAYLLLPIPAVASTMAVGLEMVKKVIWISIVASLINIALSVSLVHSLGLAGLLTATLAAEVFMVWPYLRAMMRITGVQAGQVFGPLTRIFTLAVPFVSAHLLLNYCCADQLAVWLCGATVLALIHYLASYLVLLSASERSYVMQKLTKRWRKP